MTHKPSFLSWLSSLMLAGLVLIANSPRTALSTPNDSSPTPPTDYPAHQPVRYWAQSGDSLEAVALRFGVRADEIVSPDPIQSGGLLDPGQLLVLPPRLTPISYQPALLADGEFVLGPSAASFDTAAYLKRAGGYLSAYRQYLRSTDWTSAADLIDRVALENSISPRVFIALLEQACNCVNGPLPTHIQPDYLLGITDFHYQGLYGQLRWAANEVSRGYYGWRTGLLTEISLPDGTIFQPEPVSNSASVAIQVYFASALSTRLNEAGHPWSSEQARADQDISVTDWRRIVDPQDGFAALYRQLFPDVDERVRTAKPLFPPGIQQPTLILPFEPGRVWSLSSGPHKAWDTENALAALDFAPASKTYGCVRSEAWVTAVADGIVVRSAFGAVIQDLDEVKTDGSRLPADGKEQTGWAVMYMHIETRDRAPEGIYLQAGDRIGHPSCEGGPATGTHTHVARKYNGEWVAAGGPLPFNLDGWIAQNGAEPYQGTLTLAGQTVIAQPNGAFVTRIFRPEAEPQTVITPTVTVEPNINEP